ncbi:hypothetical protein PN499_26510 [Kamptonema animale CS-326]|uniref:hypothetical protein n=1 Tax=Kamptonema animale TaxID=92934 RepID=UPI00232E9F5B|nr:hypothetical protein [Kamptonema animale]MDB9514761.1 hypothetical protein [Kamptonema animale CS-326]
MGELINLNPQGGIPDEIARDTEVASAIATHLATTDPHPGYLTQTEGDGRYRQTATPLTDADIPTAIARDAEVTAAINAHLAAADPHPGYLTQTEGDGRYRQVALTNNADLIDGIDSSQIVFGDDWSKTVGTNIDNVFSSGKASGFFDGYSGGTYPGGITHLNGFQSRHRNNSNIWGMQAGCQHNVPNEFYFRTISSGVWNPWRRIWNDGNFDPTFHAQNFNGTTAKSIGYSGGTFFSESGNSGYEVRGRDSSSAAYISFHRPGAFACHLGLDTDNQLKIGGWSFGGAAYKLWHEGNFNAQNAPGGIYGSLQILGGQLGYAGINFSGALNNPSLMLSLSGNISGLYNPTYGWNWQYTEGAFYIRSPNGASEGTYLGLSKSVGGLPGYYPQRYPTVKTDFPYLYFSAGGAYSSHIDQNGVYSAISDYNKKTNIRELDYQETLERIKYLPVCEYSFIDSDPRVKSVNTFAQAFWLAFRLGGDLEILEDSSPTQPNKMIATSDVAGICLAGIKALLERVEKLELSLLNLSEKE